MSAHPSTPGRVVSLELAGPTPSRADLAPLRPLLLSLNEAAQVLGVSRTTVKHLVAQGDLPVIRIGARVLVERAAIRAFIRAARTKSQRAARDPGDPAD